MLDYFHVLTQTGDTFGSSEICINSSSTKALSGTSSKLCKTGIPGTSMTGSNLYVFLP